MVAEAMLCGCTPVVSRIGALPEVVGDSGYVVPAVNLGNLDVAASVIAEALNRPKGTVARERVAARFSLRRREQALLDGLAGLVGNKGAVDSQGPINLF